MRSSRRSGARALGAGVLAGAVAFAGLFVLHSRRPSALPRPACRRRPGGRRSSRRSRGATTLALVWLRRFVLARYAAALAVAAIIAGWALAQQPLLLPHLTIRQAAAGHDTLVAVIVAVVAGAVDPLPLACAALPLVLGGTLDTHLAPAIATPSPSALVTASGTDITPRIAGAAFIAAIGFLTVADAAWAHAVGVALPARVRDRRVHRTHPRPDCREARRLTAAPALQWTRSRPCRRGSPAGRVCAYSSLLAAAGR